MKNIKLSIIVPVYNEEKTLPFVLRNLVELSIKGVTIEIIVVDDGSSDKTVENTKKFLIGKKQIYLIQHKENKGKGSAVRSGIQKASGDYVLIQDADLEYNPKDIVDLLQPILRGEAEVIYGTRLRRLPNFTRDERTLSFFMHYLGNKLLSLITSVLYGQWITDMETGYKIFPREPVLDMHLKSKRFDFEPEISAKLMKRGYKIFEIPVSTNPRSGEEGKKLNALRDGPIALMALIKYRFSD